MTQLTDLKVRKAHPQNKAYAISDGGGLFLFVSPNGSKNWHFRFSFNNKQQRISFGSYPIIDLKTARTLRHDAQTLIAKGIDPRDERKAVREKEAPQKKVTFAKFAQEWQIFKAKKMGFDKLDGRKSTIAQIGRAMKKDFLPKLGDKPMAEITRKDVVNVIRAIENRQAFDVARKCRGWLNEIFRHALVEGLVEYNPATDLDVVSLKAPPTKHNPYLKTSELPEFLARLNHYPGYRQTVLGIRLLLLTGVRTGELRYAEPEHFDLENAIWRIPPTLVKQLQRRVRTTNDIIPPYLVPLPKQAVAIIKELLEMRYPWQRYLLCHQYDPKKIISENTLNYGIRRMGYKDRLTGHGIRATLSTALNEIGYELRWIEAQLSHSSPDKTIMTSKVSKFYNHAEYVEQRRGMMQDWADRIDQWEKEGLAQKQISSDRPPADTEVEHSESDLCKAA